VTVQVKARVAKLVDEAKAAAEKKFCDKKSIVQRTQEIRQHVQRDADKEIESINKEIEKAVEHAKTQ
jgi:hypothetical protein